MINIRLNTFETNSSSTHSLVILGDRTFKNALKAACPEVADKFTEMFSNDKVLYTKKEIIDSLLAIGAKVKDSVLDLSEVDESHYDFGYTGPIAYADPAHKILFVLTMLDDDDWGKDRFKSFLDQVGIQHIIPPTNGYTGIDHQSRDEIEDQVRYDIVNFVSRKDYVLVLDHD